MAEMEFNITGSSKFLKEYAIDSIRKYIDDYGIWELVHDDLVGVFDDNETDAYLEVLEEDFRAQLDSYSLPLYNIHINSRGDLEVAFDIDYMKSYNKFKQLYN